MCKYSYFCKLFAVSSTSCSCLLSVLIKNLFIDHTENKRNEEKTEDVIAVPRRTKVSSISLNIPAAGLGSRPPSIVSTSTTDEGGFNEPCPSIKAKLKPHDNDSACGTPTKSEAGSELSFEETEKKCSESKVEAIYAVPHKPNSLLQQRSTTSTDSAASQVTVIPQKSIDSDIMYNNPPDVITNSVLAELESQESYERHCREALRREKKIEDETPSSKNTEGSTTDLTDSAIDLENIHEKSEPFLMIRESLQSSTKATLLTDVAKSEANILDLNDVEYADADASDSEQNNSKVTEADAMTPAEAENLLSSK